jgi:hypothetical protein
MHVGTKIAIGVAVAGAIGYVAYKFNKTPTLTVYNMNPLDGSGSYKFGKTSNPIGPSGIDGGWGFSGTWVSFTPNVGWTFQITKNGAIVKTIAVIGAGTY